MRACDFSSNSLLAVTGGLEKKVKIWDTELATEKSFILRKQPVKCTIFDKTPESNNNIIVFGGDDKQICWLDQRDQKLVKTFEVDDVVSSIEQSFDGRVIIASAGKKLYFFDTITKNLNKSIEMDYTVSSASINNDHTKVVVGGSDPWIRIYDYEKEEETELYKAHHGPIWSTSFSPDSKLYATASEDGTVRLWRVNSQEPYGLWL